MMTSEEYDKLTDEEKRIIVYHNSRFVTCTMSTDQTKLAPYERRVIIDRPQCLGLNPTPRPRALIVHKDNIRHEGNTE